MQSQSPAPVRHAGALVRAALACVRILVRVVYRLRVHGAANLPRSGGALLAPNHVTFVDGLLLVASVPREIRFLAEESYFRRWWSGPVLRAIGAIPVSAGGGPRVVLRALREAGAHLAAGHVVCIFPEGQLTRTGSMQAFRRGMERIARGRGAPIVPVHLDRLWGSVFSFARQGPATAASWTLPYRVTVSIGAPLPEDTPSWAVRRRVEELGEAAWRARRRPLLHRAFLRGARTRPWRYAVGDVVRGDLSRVRLLAAAIVIARGMAPRWRAEGAAGVLLPCSVAAAATQLAAALAGRPCVPLNWTVGRAALASAARQAGVRSVLTSRAFLEKARIELPPDLEPVFLEDLGAASGPLQRAAALLAALFLPARLLEKLCGAQQRPEPGTVVAILFSSGSTGEPKGVPLTHDNLASNVLGAAQVLHVEPRDRMLWLLPPFHAFGTLSTWFGLVHGVGLIAQPSPLDAAAVGHLAEGRRATLLLCTPTFLALYTKRVAPEQFGSLRVVLTGAERLPERTASSFEERFGLRPIEGYGTTECAPVVATSAPSVRRPGIFQPGSRRGSVGQPLPGVAVRVVDLETGAEQPPGVAGMLLVRGANVFSGYLGRPELTAQVLRDGWYVTGDVALLEEDGFVRITDRLARFSKIGGEMVPHGRIEEALHAAAEADAPTFAVTALEDERKGERLAVVHTADPARVPELLAKLAESGLPNLFLPRADAFVRVESLPLLGTGKLDLGRVRAIARAALADGAAG